MKRALVTGAAGFVGRWLCAALIRDGWDVSASAHSTGDVDAATVSGPWGSLESVRWFTGDIRDAAHWQQLFADTRPNAVINLAAVSHVQHATANPTLAWEVNLLAPVRLLHEATAARGRREIDPTVLLVGSAEQYGRQPDSAAPFAEDTAQVPLTVYGATKAAQELAGLQAFRSTGLRVIAARPFPHSGAGQEPRFVIPAMVARAEALRSSGSTGPMMTGNLTPIRDFLHVSDVVAAYIALLHSGRPGTAYNVASGTGVRAVDVPVLVGDASRLSADTGWKPVRSFDDIIDDLLAYHRTHAATH
jgi:GDP-4-dehydro-6-deoxy-D-mannose reductase